MSAEIGALYRVHATRVWRYARARLPSDDDAEDVTSDVFMRAIRSHHSFDPTKGTESAWIVGIARHAVAEWWAKAATGGSDRHAAGGTPRSRAMGGGPRRDRGPVGREQGSAGQDGLSDRARAGGDRPALRRGAVLGRDRRGHGHLAHGSPHARPSGRWETSGGDDR